MANGDNSKPCEDFRKELILKEIEIVQNEIARFDSNGLQIKGWCITTWGGLIAYGVEKHQWVIVLAAVITTSGFGFVEFMYRRFQLRFIARSKEIEDYLKAELVNYRYDVHGSATTETKWRDDLRKINQRMHHFTAFYPALVFLALSCVAYVIFSEPAASEATRVNVSGVVTNITPNSTTNSPLSRP